MSMQAGVIIGAAMLAAGTASDSIGSLTIAQWVWNVLGGLAMLWMTSKVREFGDLKENVSKMAEKMVDMKLAALMDVIETLNTRLDQGDGEFDKLGERGTKLEVALSAQSSELMASITREFVTKDDMRLMASQVGGLGDRVGELARTLAHFEGVAEGMARSKGKAV